MNKANMYKIARTPKQLYMSSYAQVTRGIPRHSAAPTFSDPVNGQIRAGSVWISLDGLTRNKDSIPGVDGWTCTEHLPKSTCPVEMGPVCDFDLQGVVFDRDELISRI